MDLPPRPPAPGLTGGPGRGGRRAARWQPREKLLRRCSLRRAAQRQARSGEARSGAAPGGSPRRRRPATPRPPPRPRGPGPPRVKAAAAAPSSRSPRTQPFPGGAGGPRDNVSRVRGIKHSTAPGAAQRPPPQRERSGRAAAPRFGSVRCRRGHRLLGGARPSAGRVCSGSDEGVCLRVRFSQVLGTDFHQGGEWSRFLCTETGVGVGSRRTDGRARAAVSCRCALLPTAKKVRRNSVVRTFRRSATRTSSPSSLRVCKASTSELQSCHQ